jgi:DNA polymerase-4
MERIIIHSDMNSCYASIECSLNPELKGKPVAVGGSVEDRHGIILAKTAEAKKFGVTTGEAIWQAQRKCPELIVVPPHFDIYSKYSSLAKDIYRRYTDKIEPMGLDEAWCDITGSILLFGSVQNITDGIRDTFKSELGITVSIGVSYNKIFAKLGSDLAGIDEVVTITKENYKDVVWPLSVGSIMGVGRNTAKKLKGYGINTVGDLARIDSDWLKLTFGVVGVDMWKYANGYDNSRVMPDGYEREVKSIGHGVTCREDLVSDEEVWLAFLRLSQDVSRRLKKEKLSATAVQISVRDTFLMTRQFQCETEYPTQSAMDISKTALRLFKENYPWLSNVRALSVRAINLCDENAPVQLDLTGEYKNHDRQKLIDDTALALTEKFGKDAIFNCSVMLESKMPDMQGKKSPLPIRMYK